jgi:Tfp pilus assembly protein PilF
MHSYLELQLGKIEIRRGNPDGARSYLERSLAEDPTSTECKLALAAVDLLAKKDTKMLR